MQIGDSRFGIRFRISNPLMIPTVYWFTQNLSDVPQDNDWLSEEERCVLSGLRFEKRRNDWRLGRWTAKKVIAQCLSQVNLKPSLLKIRAAADGAPEAFYDNKPLDISISISHAAQRSLCAAGPKEYSVGCDLEVLDPREDSLIQDYFTPEEIELCHKAKDKTVVTNLIWSAKESMLKSLREGLRMDTRSVQALPCFGNSEQEWQQWTGHCAELSRAFYGWWRIEDGFVYTIASRRRLII
jgi:4'-phosphopantetheinyl transferase